MESGNLVIINLNNFYFLHHKFYLYVLNSTRHSEQLSRYGCLFRSSPILGALLGHNTFLLVFRSVSWRQAKVVPRSFIQMRDLFIGENQLDWDTILPDALRTTWVAYMEELVMSGKVEFQRCVKPEG